MNDVTKENVALENQHSLGLRALQLRPQNVLGVKWPEDKESQGALLGQVKEALAGGDTHARLDDVNLVVSGPDGKHVLAPGGYLVIRDNGTIRMYNEDEFNARYEFA